MHCYAYAYAYTQFQDDIFFPIGGDFEFTYKVPLGFYETYKNQNGINCVKEGWSSKNALVIWEKLQLPCCLAFRRIKYRTEDISVTGGYCRQKNCLISITSTLPHHSNILSVSITNYKPKIWHDAKLKRKILPNERVDLEEKLKQKTAYALRSELADVTLKDDKLVAAHIPNLNQLRLIRSRSQCPEAGKNPIISLYEMRKVHIDCIQKIDYFPFTVYYSTPGQAAYYKKEIEYHREAIISLDASGVGLKSPTDDNTYIFLYIASVQGKNTSCIPFNSFLIIFFCGYIRPKISFSSLGEYRTVPVCQQLTQSHDANSIRSWLTFCFADKKKPREVIIDASEALISACVQTFSECPNGNAYLNRCAKALLNEGAPPPCLIRLDRSHFVKSVISNKHQESRSKSQSIDKRNYRLFGKMRLVFRILENIAEFIHYHEE